MAKYPIIAAFIAAIYLASASISAAASRGCLAAIAVSGIAGVASLVLLCRGRSVSTQRSLAFFLAAGVVRLLLMLAGSVIIIFSVGVSLMWFVGWLAFFYIGLLIVEIVLLVRHNNRSRETEVDKG